MDWSHPSKVSVTLVLGTAECELLSAYFHLNQFSLFHWAKSIYMTLGVTFTSGCSLLYCYSLLFGFW